MKCDRCGRDAHDWKVYELDEYVLCEGCYSVFEDWIAFGEGA